MTLRLLARVENLPKRFKLCSFKNFETNKDNSNLFNICRAWRGEESIILTGNIGTGKTHLAIAMLRNFPMIERDEEEANLNLRRLHWQEKSVTEGEKEKIEVLIKNELWKYRSARCLFISFIELFLLLNAAAFDESGKLGMLNRYIGVSAYDCICFDDLGTEKLTEAKRENLHYIIDGRYKAMLPTIITSNFTLSEIADYDPRVASRFVEMGKILQFNGSDYRNRK